jgi:uncharacterized coiled-coil protein SlyX
MPEDEALERRIATLERRLARHQKFIEAACWHIPALIEGDRQSARYRAALAWWEQCRERPVQSSP